MGERGWGAALALPFPACMLPCQPACLPLLSPPAQARTSRKCSSAATGCAPSAVTSATAGTALRRRCRCTCRVTFLGARSWPARPRARSPNSPPARRCSSAATRPACAPRSTGSSRASCGTRRATAGSSRCAHTCLPARQCDGAAPCVALGCMCARPPARPPTRTPPRPTPPRLQVAHYLVLTGVSDTVAAPPIPGARPAWQAAPSRRCWARECGVPAAGSALSEQLGTQPKFPN